MYCRTRPPHPRANANGLYPLHRVLAENKIGRPLRSDEHVHHADGAKDNNDPSNLQVLRVAEHARLHRPELEKIEFTCGVCGSDFQLKPRVARLRIRRSKSGKLYCSRVCARSMQVRG